jgi:hypothetical protein
MKEYTVQLWGFDPMHGEDKFLDETSVDARTKPEALDTALDLFKEFHPHYDEAFIRTNMQISDTKEISQADLQDILGICWNCEHHPDCDDAGQRNWADCGDWKESTGAKT